MPDNNFIEYLDCSRVITRRIDHILACADNKCRIVAVDPAGNTEKLDFPQEQQFLDEVKQYCSKDKFVMLFVGPDKWEGALSRFNGLVYSIVTLPDTFIH